MRFSLVVATVGRTAELTRLFESLARQSHRDFEVIVIDQNADGRLLPIVQFFAGRFAIRHLTAAPGLSRARNLGLREIAGDMVGFPDDDCWYGDDLLKLVNDAMLANPEWDGLIGDSVDESEKPTLPWRDRRGRLSPAMSWRRAVTYAYFLRRAVLDRVGGFDETLGPGSGSAWGCGEDNDLMLRTLKAGFQVEYDPAVRVHHPLMFPSFDDAGRNKRYRYALADGHLLRKHPMPLWWVILFFMVPAGRVILASVRFRHGEMRSHWATLMGRARGFFSRKNGLPARAERV